MQVHTRPEANVIPWQFANLMSLNLTKQRAAYELLWIESDGEIFGGAQAISKILISAGGFWWPLGWLVRIPPFRWVAHWGYRFVANNRDKFPGGTPTCAPPASTS